MAPGSIRRDFGRSAVSSDPRLIRDTALDWAPNIEAATGKYVRANGQHHVPWLGDERLGCHVEFGLGWGLEQACQTTDEDTPRASCSFVDLVHFERHQLTSCSAREVARAHPGQNETSVKGEVDGDDHWGLVGRNP